MPTTNGQPTAGAVKLAKEIIVGDNRPLQFAQAVDRHVEPLIKALEFYSNRTAYLHGSECPSICTDEGEKARVALQQWKDGAK